MGELIKVATPIVGEEEIQAVAEVLRSGRYVQGPTVKEFEETFARYVGTKHAVATNSGTAAIHVSLATAGIGPGDEVIVPPLTFFATVEAVLHQNAIPIFADIDPEIYNLDPDDVARHITDKTKAIIPVHLYGHPAEMDPIMDLAKDHNLKVIEDCAQAHGAEYKGKKVGSFGHMGCWSFYATKNMTTGEGGIITTDDDKVAEIARAIRSHGMTGRDDHAFLGYNYRMDEMRAAIGIVQLAKLDKLNAVRSKNSLYLIEHLKDVEWLIPPTIKPYVKHAFFWCPFRVDEENLGMDTSQLIKILREKGVEVRHRYYEPLYRQEVLVKKQTYSHHCPFNCPYYNRNIDYMKVYLPNVEKIAGKMIGLPNHPALTKEELDKVTSVVKSIR